MTTTTKQNLDTRMAKALSHPVRVQALHILNERVASPSQIAKELDLPVANVSYHVNTLLRLGCLEEVQTRHVRGSIEHLYRATTRPYASLEDMVAMPDSAREQLAGQFAQEIFTDLFEAFEQGALTEESKPYIAWTRLRLDEAGKEKVYEILLETHERVMQEMAASLGRLQDGESGGPEVSMMHSVLHYKSSASAE